MSLFDLGSDNNPNKNWISLLQSISLYCDYKILTYPKKIYRNILGLEFGKNYEGFHNVWIFDLECKDDFNLDELLKIIQHLPIITMLNETAEIPLKCALVDTENKNISFLLMKNDNK